MLAKNYDGRDPSGLWLSEKLDGVRAVWTGRELLTRAGNRIDCPAWFTQGLPSVSLDGELWAGRGKFQLAKGMAQSIGRDAEWRKIAFGVFDMPGVGRCEERFAALRRLHLPPHCFAVAQTRCTGTPHLSAVFDAVKALGGEGVMLRLPLSPYLFGERSAYWQKVKRAPNSYAPNLSNAA